MPFYQKKPVVIEARELTIHTIGEIQTWCGSTQTWSKPPMRAISGILVPTLESPHEASFGDFIIKGVEGEFYPCKPNIFHKTYEPMIKEK